MQPKPSIRYPELLVYPDGEIFDTIRNVFLRNNNGAASRNGPVAYYYKNKRVHQLSRLSMVYETFVKNDVISRGEFVDVIDGDYENVHYSNVIAKKKGSNTARKEEVETYRVLGWNGDCEIYL